MKSLTLATAVLATTALATAEENGGEGDGCVKNGESVTLTFDRPDLAAPGFPTGAKWRDGTGAPEAWDKDFWSEPDMLGEATPSADGGQASVTLTNTAGTIYGPAGTDVEGGLEGDCVETYMVWYYDFPATITLCLRGTGVFAPYGIGVEVSQSSCMGYATTIKSWTRPAFRDPVEVCPC